MTAAGEVPTFDASGGADVIDADSVAAFRELGALRITGVIASAELEALQAETAELVRRSVEERPDDPDFMRKVLHGTDDEVPFRVEYVVDKGPAARALQAHPFILRTVEALQGPTFIPTWDSMVFKQPGAGAQIPWHRDGGLYDDISISSGGRVFNVDIYLDEADLSNCLYAIPGSNTWDGERAAAECARRNAHGVDVDGTVPVRMNPGDVLLHNIVLLHGSQPTVGPLRRVIYLEYRPEDVEFAHGPHTPAYVEAKRHVLAACIRHRAAQPYAAGERAWARADGLDDPAWAEDPPTFRYHHFTPEFWRGAA